MARSNPAQVQILRGNRGEAAWDASKPTMVGICPPIAGQILQRCKIWACQIANILPISARSPVKNENLFGFGRIASIKYATCCRFGRPPPNDQHGRNLALNCLFPTVAGY